MRAFRGGLQANWPAAGKQASRRQTSPPRDGIGNGSSGGKDGFSWWSNEAMIDVGMVASWRAPSWGRAWWSKAKKGPGSRPELWGPTWEDRAVV